MEQNPRSPPQREVAEEEIMKSEIEKAYIVAELAHHGQFRRDGVTPYFSHPLEVSRRVSEKAKPAALLHDVLEDTWVTVGMLEAYGFSTDTIMAVELLTKRKDEDYFAYIGRIKGNAIAKEVKIADIKHNLSADPKPNSVMKYRDALEFLKSN